MTTKYLLATANQILVNFAKKSFEKQIKVRLENNKKMTSYQCFIKFVLTNFI